MNSFSFKNNFLRIEILDYGATVKGIYLADGTNILLQLQEEDYKLQKSYIGQIVGRYANRIKNGAFFIDSQKIQLTQNESNNHLHGGLRGLDKVIWDVDVENDGVSLNYLSKDGEEGYPANVHFKVKYSLMQNSFHIDLFAKADQKTIINPTSHLYFNKKLFNKIHIFSEHFLEIDQEGIPNGKLGNHSAPIDLNNEKWDHCFIFPDSSMKKMALVIGENLNIKISSTLPGAQFYTGDFLDTQYFKARDGFCIEPQYFPDSPNHSNFPSCYFDSDHHYHHRIRFEIDYKNP